MKKQIILFLALCLSVSAHALPQAVEQAFPQLQKIGSSDYSVFFIDVYDIDYLKSDQADAFFIKYKMDISGEKRLTSLMDSLKRQKLNVNYTAWKETFKAILPDVKDKDTITAVRQNGVLTFFHNNKQTAQLADDPILTDAFFNVWLGTEADTDMRNELLALK